MAGESICSLVAGGVGDWHGLEPFDIDDAPACAGDPTASDWLKFKQGYARYRIFRRGSEGPEVWLFSFDGKMVELLEVFGLTATEMTVAALGQPELIAGYPGAAQLQRPLGQPGEELREAIYGARGLAVLLAYARDQPPRMVRVRGFAAMSARSYYERFVELPEVEIPG